MSWEIRWKRKNAPLYGRIEETWTLHVPLARTWAEAGAMVAAIGKEHDPLVITVVPENTLRKPRRD